MLFEGVGGLGFRVSSPPHNPCLRPQMAYACWGLFCSAITLHAYWAHQRSGRNAAWVAFNTLMLASPCRWRCPFQACFSHAVSLSACRPQQRSLGCLLNTCACLIMQVALQAAHASALQEAHKQQAEAEAKRKAEAAGEGLCVPICSRSFPSTCSSSGAVFGCALVTIEAAQPTHFWRRSASVTQRGWPNAGSYSLNVSRAEVHI